ncbi:MAG: hypothetical protein AB9897_00390 [Anaerolineaceae bacterium]
MNKRFVLIVLVLVMLSTMLASCGAKASIVGEWQGTLNTATFQRDGTVIFSILGLGVQGTYEFVDSDTVRINYQGATTEYNVKIDNDTLYLESNGITMTYDKVKK